MPNHLTAVSLTKRDDWTSVTHPVGHRRQMLVPVDERSDGDMLDKRDDSARGIVMQGIAVRPPVFPPFRAIREGGPFPAWLERFLTWCES